MFPGRDARLLQTRHQCLVGFWEITIFSTLEGLEKDAISVNIDHHNGVIVASLQPHRQLAILIEEDSLPLLLHVTHYAPTYRSSQLWRPVGV